MQILLARFARVMARRAPNVRADDIQQHQTDTLPAILAVEMLKRYSIIKLMNRLD